MGGGTLHLYEIMFLGKLLLAILHGKLRVVTR